MSVLGLCPQGVMSAGGFVLDLKKVEVVISYEFTLTTNLNGMHTLIMPENGLHAVGVLL